MITNAAPRLLIGLVILFLAAMEVANAATPPQCPRRIVRLELIPLGNLGGNGGEALALNERGNVIGRSTLANGSSASFVWHCSRGIYRFPGQGAAQFINNRSQIVGNVSGQVFLWDSVNGTQRLGPGRPTGLNDRGDVGFIAGPVDGGGSVYTAGTGAVALRDVTGATFREVLLNNRRVAGGYAYNAPGPTGPRSGYATWTAAQGLRIFAAAGTDADDPFVSGSVRAFNDHGELLGTWTRPNFTIPFIVRPNGAVDYLVPLADGVRINAYDFNNLRQTLTASSSKYFVWEPAHGFSDVDVLTFGRVSGRNDTRIAAINAINEWGWIAGSVLYAGAARTTPVLLVSVPYRDPKFTNLGQLRGQALCTALDALTTLAQQTDAACNTQR